MRIIEKIFSRDEIVCPWWLCFTFDNPLRGLIQNPYRILKGYVKPGDSILDIGPGMGFFTFPLARITGAGGNVTALDIQKEMLIRLERKIIKKKVHNVKTKLYDGNRFDLYDKYDFIMLFWMYHEVRNKAMFIGEIKSVMKPGARIFIAEPGIHVSLKKYYESLKLFTNAGFKVIDEPEVALSRSSVLEVKI